jgi:hypothetical protein
MNTVVNQIINSNNNNNNNSNKLMQMSTATDNVTAASSILTGLLKPRLLQLYSNNIVLDNQQTNKVVHSYLESNVLQQQSDIKEQIEENLQQQQNELIKTDDSSMPLHEIDEKQNNAEDIEENSKLIDNNPIIMNDVLPEQHDNNLMNSNEIVQDVLVIVNNNNNIDENLELIIEPENLNIKQKTDQDEVNEDQQIDNIVINFQENDDDDDDDDEEDSAIKLNTINY